VTFFISQFQLSDEGVGGFALCVGSG